MPEQFKFFSNLPKYSPNSNVYYLLTTYGHSKTLEYLFISLLATDLLTSIESYPL